MVDPRDKFSEDSDSGHSDPTVPPTPIDRPLEVTRDFEPGERDGSDLVDTDFTLNEAFIKLQSALGKYVIQGGLGHGGMGIVLKALDPDLNRTVAIKVLSPTLAQSATARRRFQREARAAAAISHPNVLTIHSVEEHERTPFLVMEFVAGQSLKEYIASRGKLEPMEVIRLSHQIAQGLAAAHAQGVIHRDVKPGNVMLHEGATRVRIMDFGLARVAFDNAELTSHDHTVGTPAYMAPEQVRGESVDARADLFSLGCMIYAMFAGASPFLGRTHAETIHRILATSPAKLHEVDPAVPEVLSDMVDKLIHKNADDRYQSAYEVAEILGRLLVQLNQTPTDKIPEVLRNGTAIARAPQAPTKPSLRASATFTTIAGVSTLLIMGIVTALILWKPGVRSDNSLPSTESQGEYSSTSNQSQSKASRLTVGSGSGVDCATIAEALRRATPDCVITVVGPGPYIERIQVGPEHRGLKLIAQPRAILRTPAGTQETDAITIKDASQITVKGFDFEIDAVNGRAIHVLGVADNIDIEECSFHHMLGTHGRSLVVVASQYAAPEAWVRIRHCRFSAAMGSVMCLVIASNDAAASRVACEGCQFQAPNTHLFATQSCRQLLLSGNVFLGGNNAINLSLKAWEPDSRIEIVNNTFLRTRYWLGLMDSFRAGSVPTGKTDSRVCNNLILGGHRVQGEDHDQWQPVFAAWRFSSNWWERDVETKIDADKGGRLATLFDRLDVMVRDDPADPRFLVPAHGSPLLTSGCGGDLPGYIGAKSLSMLVVEPGNTLKE